MVLSANHSYLLVNYILHFDSYYCLHKLHCLVLGKAVVIFYSATFLSKPIFVF